MATIDSLAWSNDAGAAAALLGELGCGPSAGAREAAPLTELAREAGFVATPMSGHVSTLPAALARFGPGVLKCPGGGYLAVLESRRRQLRVVDPGGMARWIQTEQVTKALSTRIQTQVAKTLEPVFEVIGSSARCRGRALNVLADDYRVDMGWRFVEAEPATSLQQTQRSVLSRIIGLVGLYGFQFLIGLAAWYLVGRAALYPDSGANWIGYWLLLLATALGLRTWIFHGQGRLAIDISCSIKQALLGAGLRLEPEAVRGLGASNLLSRVLESEAFESNTVRGAIGAMFALLELVAALVLLVLLKATTLAALLAGIAVLTAGAVWATHRAKHRWIRSRLGVTTELVEGLEGHATRSVQQDQSRWYDGQDEALVNYLDASEELDQRTRCWKLVPRLWLLLALPAYLLFHAGHESFGANAAVIGVTLLAYLGLGQLTGGVSQLSHATIVWQLLRPLRQPAPQTPGNWRARRELASQSMPTLEAQDLGFAYRENSRPVLSGASAVLRGTDRALLEGCSGSGKSTLASILAGHSQPSSGRVALGGLDLESVGLEAWRKRVCLAPQFHQNIIFPETLAFNLLLGRRWPASDEDLKEAQVVCGELGLGELLQRMPGGLMQVVGDGGWPLSHGEAARVQIARAVLQEPSVLILDESLGPLDPRSFLRVLECLKERIPSLIVVAHA